MSLTPAAQSRLHDLQRRDINPEYHPLITKILGEAGGDHVLMPSIEEDLDILIRRGRIWPVRPRPLLMKGEPSRCHGNSAHLYERNPGRVSIVTGYGMTLESDGMRLWRQHTWLWNRAAGRIVETTVIRQAYWGTELTDDEALTFCGEND